MARSGEYKAHFPIPLWDWVALNFDYLPSTALPEDAHYELDLYVPRPSWADNKFANAAANYWEARDKYEENYRTQINCFPFLMNAGYIARHEEITALRWLSKAGFVAYTGMEEFGFTDNIYFGCNGGSPEDTFWKLRMIILHESEHLTPHEKEVAIESLFEFHDGYGRKEDYLKWVNRLKE